MKRSIIALLIAVLLLCACGQKEAPPEDAVARIGEDYIYTETIEKDRLIGVTGTDREITEGKVLNMLMLLEADKLGLAATEEELAEFMASQEKAWNMAGVKEQIEAMYAPIGISFKEYKAMIEDIAPNTVTRQKLRDHYGQEFCTKEGLQFTKVNPPEGMEEYIDKELQKLWDKYKGEYAIFVD